jgi:hypothetical protein
VCTRKAIELAEANLNGIVTKGHTLAPGYVGEQFSNGYRNAYLGQLQALGRGEGMVLLQDIINAPDVPSDERQAAADRIRAVLRTKGEKWVVEQAAKHKLWWHMWSASKKPSCPSGPTMLADALEASAKK